MPKISETITIELLCSDFHILREAADNSNMSLEEYIGDILETHAIKLALDKGVISDGN